MICPLMSGVVVYQGEPAPYWVECQQESCGFWAPDVEVCPIFPLLAALARLGDLLQNPLQVIHR